MISSRLLHSVSVFLKRLTLTSRALLMRFVSVSLLSTLTYFVVAIIAGVVLQIGGKTTVALAYLFALPINFIGHRRFTFRSDAHIALQVIKFIAVHTLILALSTSVMFLLVDYGKFPFLVGLILSTAMIMVLSFVLLGGWVFRRTN